MYDDLYRRDFTINAIAYSKEEDLYYDFFNGFDDLQNRILKCTFSPDKSFSDDPLRILRIKNKRYRFCLRFRQFKSNTNRGLYGNEKLYVRKQLYYIFRN